jgi:DNA-binding CsgD family transcriptional regulator
MGGARGVPKPLVAWGDEETVAWGAWREATRRWPLGSQAAPSWAREVLARLAADDFPAARAALAEARTDGAGTARDRDLMEQLTLRLVFYEGSLDALRDASETAIASATWRGGAGAGTVATARTMLALVDVERGELEEAARHLRCARRLTAVADGEPAGDVVLLAEALYDDARSRPDLALRGLRPLFEAPSAWSETVVAGPSILAVASRLAVDTGHPALASRIIAFAEDLAREYGQPPGVAAVIAQAKGYLLQEPALLVDAARDLASSPRRRLAASALEDAALALERAGDLGRAVGLAREALAAYAECGATVGARRVRQWLRSHGVNVIPGQRRGRPAFGWEALSDAELSVVRLAAEGLTNREIGDRLYVSRYTVDTHLRHVFAKLGIKSRVALARAYLDRLSEATDPHVASREAVS